ncbi:hypothetical protein D3C76_840410 [compost metagenome]
MPAFFHVFQAHLDHRHANDLAVFFQAMGQVVAGLARGAADAIEPPRFTAHGCLEIGTERQVFAQERVGIAPVAGGLHPAIGVENEDCPAAAAAIEALEVFVDGLAGAAVGVGEQMRDAVFQLQQARQVGVFADFAFDRARVQLQLALAVFAEGADTVALADQVASHSQADHQQDDQWW